MLIRKSVHVRSGTSNQWKKHLNPELRKRFVELYGDVLIKLGYEENHDWVDA